MENFTNEQVELSKEELAKRRKEITAFYKSNISHLEVQKEYESLLTDIEELRAKRLQAQMFIAQVQSGGQNDEAAEEFEQAKRKTLKRVKNEDA